MKVKSVALLILTLLLIQSCQLINKSCFTNKQNRINDKLECQKKWIYKDLKTSKELKVLYFEKSMRHSISFYPNIIIGIDEKSDTIAVIDYTYPCLYKIINNDTIKVLPNTWSDIEKETITLKGYIDVERKILCSVKYVYYAEIIWRGDAPPAD